MLKRPYLILGLTILLGAKATQLGAGCPAPTTDEAVASSALLAGEEDISPQSTDTESEDLDQGLRDFKVEITDAASAELLYWNNKNLGFGHVAVRIFEPGCTQPSYYISFAMGNDYERDRSKHGKEPVRVALPPKTALDFARFESWYLGSIYAAVASPDYPKSYDLLRHNCAHAILSVLRHLGYELSIRGERHLALRPRTVFQSALRLGDTHAP